LGSEEDDCQKWRNLLAVLEDRHGWSSTTATSKLAIKDWHAVIGDPRLAEAILDRLVHNVYKINLKVETMRNRQAKLTRTTAFEQQCKTGVATLQWVAAFAWNGWQTSAVYALKLQKNDTIDAEAASRPTVRERVNIP